MASKNVTITYPDGDQSRINQALKAHYGQVEDPPGSGTFRDRTNAEAWNEFESSCKRSLRHLVRNVEKEAARAAAEAGVADVGVV
jgi:hypothetical protein